MLSFESVDELGELMSFYGISRTNDKWIFRDITHIAVPPARMSNDLIERGIVHGTLNSTK